MEMQARVNAYMGEIKSSKDKQTNIIKSISYKTLIDKRKHCYIPPVRSKADLYNDTLRERLIQKYNWSAGWGNHPQEFEKPPVIKGCILNEWTAGRAIMPERSYKKPKGVPGIKWAGKDGKEFGNPTEELLGKQFKHHLQNHKTQFKEFMERPAKHGVLKDYPGFITPRKKAMGMSQHGKEFMYNQHNSWEWFHRNMQSMHKTLDHSNSHLDSTLYTSRTRTNY